MREYQKLSEEIKKRKQTDSIRKNLIAVKVAMEKEERIIYLPEKDLATMEETAIVLYEVGIFHQMELINDGIPVGKIFLLKNSL